MALDYVCLTRVTAQTITIATWVPISWDTEVEDLSGYWASGTPTKIIVTTGKAGYFIATFNVGFSAGLAGRSMLSLYHYNSSDVVQTEYRRPILYGDAVGCNTAEFKMTDGDYLVPTVWRNASHTATARFEMVRMGA